MSCSINIIKQISISTIFSQLEPKIKRYTEENKIQSRLRMRTWELATGTNYHYGILRQKAEIVFIVCCHFPNLSRAQCKYNRNTQITKQSDCEKKIISKFVLSLKVIMPIAWKPVNLNYINKKMNLTSFT